MILHIAPSEAWEAARRQGSYAPESLRAQGFIHCSLGRQLRAVLRRTFAGVEGLVLLGVDESRLSEAPHYEFAGDDRFPHLRMPLPVAAVVACEPLPSDAASAEALPWRLAALIAAAHGAEPSGHVEWPHHGFTVSTDLSRLPRGLVHRWLSEQSYWTPGIPRPVLDVALDNSVCFGLYDSDGGLAGFARLVTDRATYAYLCDVFVAPEHRGRGLGTFLVQCAADHPALQGLRAWTLATRDAHGLYRRFGFAPLAHPENRMLRGRPAREVYGSG